MFGAEKAFRAIDRQLLGHVHVFATAVPALSRITFGVFVSQNTALCFHDRAAGEILRSDQLDIFALPLFFRANDIEDFRINASQGVAIDKFVPKLKKAGDWNAVRLPW